MVIITLKIILANLNYNFDITIIKFLMYQLNSKFL
jgi:hypothetical protein